MTFRANKNSDVEEKLNKLSGKTVNHRETPSMLKYD